MIPVHAYEGRRVAVFGLGRTGIAAAKSLAAGGALVSAWDDGETARESAAAAGVPLDDLNRRDWGDIAALVLSPGVPLTHPAPHRMVELARAVGAPVIGDTELFAREINAMDAADRPRLIGVTGTNGKSTTTALIGHILKQSGRDVRIGGNIGRAVLDLDPPRRGSIYVIELSSYQLDLTESLRCDVGVLLNISPDHLERHGGFDGYFRAKRRIFDMQADGGKAVIGVDDGPTGALYSRLRQSRGETEVAPVSINRVFPYGVYALGDRLFDALDGAATPVLSLHDAPGLPGRHNAQNAAAALAALRLLGIGGRAAADAMKSFPGLPHRMERVGEARGVRYVNDSKATNAEAAAQALACYGRIYWIVGGQPKSDGLSGLERFYPRIAKAYLIGEAEESFARTLKGAVAIERCGDVETALAQAARDAEADAHEQPVVLFSPACASFDQFRDFEHRGDVFRALVNAHLAVVSGDMGETV